jgi:hypothetical protein
MGRLQSTAMITLNRPSTGALILGLIPFAGMCFSVSFWDRIHPMIIGLPFNLFWLISWIVLSTLCLWAAYRIETRRERKGSPQ